jgi:GxxExxY protein
MELLELEENRIAKEIIDVAFNIHSSLGPGLLESVYEIILAKELEKRGFHVDRQKVIPIDWDDIYIEEAFRADLIINNLVIVELKSVENLSSVTKKQLLTYLRLTNLRLGLVINFGESRIKEGIHRVVNGLPDNL